MSKKKTKNKNAPAKKSTKAGAVSTKRIVTVFVSVFVGIAVILGASLGIASAVKHSSYVMYYKGIGVDEGVVNYFSAYYKTMFMKSMSNAEDTEEFWNTAPYYPATSTTHGDNLKYYTGTYIKNLIASNAIFDEMYRLTNDDKVEIKLAMQNVFESLRVSTKAEFNEAVSKFGFDYNDFKTATEMIYKDYIWPIRTFGADGSGVSSYTDYCSEYLLNYSRVKFVFIRTETKLNTGADGKITVENLTEAEKLERADYINKLIACADAINANEADSAGFEALALSVKEAYGEISENETDGYYLMSGSAFTEAFSTDMPKIAKKALELNVGEAAYIEVLSDEVANERSFVGYCFMYRDTVEDYAYTDDSESGFFGDFYLSCASALYMDMIDEYNDFEPTDKWNDISVINIPYMPYTPNYVAQFYS